MTSTGPRRGPKQRWKSPRRRRPIWCSISSNLEQQRLAERQSMSSHSPCPPFSQNGRRWKQNPVSHAGHIRALIEARLQKFKIHTAQPRLFVRSLARTDDGVMAGNAQTGFLSFSHRVTSERTEELMRTGILRLAILTVSCIAAVSGWGEAKLKRPNILWIVGENLKLDL